MLRFASGCNPCNVSVVETSRIDSAAFSFVSIHSFPRAWPVFTSKDSEPSSQRHCWLRMYSHIKGLALPLVWDEREFHFSSASKMRVGSQYGPEWSLFHVQFCTHWTILLHDSTVEVRADAVLPKESSKAPHLPARPSCKWRSKSVTKQVQRKLLPHPTPSSCCHEARKWRSKSVTKQVQHTLLSHPTPTPPHPIVVTKQVSAIARQWRSKCNVRYYPTPPQPHPMLTPNSWSGKQPASIN